MIIKERNITGAIQFFFSLTIPYEVKYWTAAREQEIPAKLSVERLRMIVIHGDLKYINRLLSMKPRIMVSWGIGFGSDRYESNLFF